MTEQLNGSTPPSGERDGPGAGTEPQTTDDLSSIMYPCLRDMAGAWFRHERTGHTLQPTALVHEAYLRLKSSGIAGWRDEVQFVAAAARVMRRVLVDHARAKAAVRRGGERRRISLAEAAPCTGAASVDLLDLDEVLDRLLRTHERAGRVIELRFFGGLSIDDTARVLGVSPRTIDMDWRFGRAWLLHELRGSGS